MKPVHKLSWYDRDRLLSFLGNKKSRPLALNTRVVRVFDWEDPLGRLHKDVILVKFYATAILGYLADGRVVLNNGGYSSTTTKKRISKIGPVSITQVKGEWWVGERRFFNGFTVGQHDRDPLAYEIALDASYGCEVARAAVKDYECS